MTENAQSAARLDRLVGPVVHCPIIEQTADGKTCGRCWFHLIDGRTCPRHGDVAIEVTKFLGTNHCTIENEMRQRKGLKLLGCPCSNS